MKWIFWGLAMTAVWWIWRALRVQRRWARRVMAAKEAEQRGDFNAAEGHWREAECVTGVGAQIRSLATKGQLAHLFYRKGELERSAALTFEALELARAGAT